MMTMANNDESRQGYQRPVTQGRNKDFQSYHWPEVGRFCHCWRPQRPVCLGALVSICFVGVVILPILLHSYVEATSEGVTKTLFQIPGLDRELNRYWRQGPGQIAHLPFLNSFCHECYTKPPNEQLTGTPLLGQLLPHRSSASLHSPRNLAVNLSKM